MTITAENDQKEKKPKALSRKNKKDSVTVVINEKVPLLSPKKRENNEFNGVSFTGAVLNLSTTIIGAGRMALPATMKVLGLVLGVTAIAFVAVLSEASLSTLLKFSRFGSSDSCGGVVGDAFGKVGRTILQACVVINNIGVLIVYMIIIVSNSLAFIPNGNLTPQCTQLRMSLKTRHRFNLLQGLIEKLLNDAVRVSYALHLMLVFPIILHPLRLNSDGLLFPSADPLVSDSPRFALITIGLIYTVFLGANYIPSIWDAFQFTGATAAVCLGFIFPAAIALRDAHGIATKKDKIISIFMIGLAVFANSVPYIVMYIHFSRGMQPRVLDVDCIIIRHSQISTNCLAFPIFCRIACTVEVRFRGMSTLVGF
ncbi:hypothetical protein RJ639_027081 [Escallonia herrerae]|uniref:Amino acid transporter transmembrane domain-containing protein n=1 Tax=Escallonia herrerae TaxID=1293975 RepID=A0AA88X4H2_9ASTE|nr:hypothetical protein RJ639_027081 [Escallonia herrerae]